jgi:beta-glucanase (GH16 family)
VEINMAITGEKRLLWSENFEYKSQSDFEQVWNFDIGDGSQHGLIGWGNNELEYYTKDAVSYSEGLRISAKKLESDTQLQCYYGPALWSSGKVHTANKVSFKYGLIEVTAKAAKGVGTWPAIWLLGCDLLTGTNWPNCGEIDVLETTGANSKNIQGTLHGPTYFGEAGLTKIIQAPESLSNDYHTYSIYWEEDKFEWYFDGQLYNTINRNDNKVSENNWPFNQHFYFILNLAIGGWFGGEVDPKLTDAEFLIKSIKHYSVNGIGSVKLN